MASTARRVIPALAAVMLALAAALPAAGRFPDATPGTSVPGTAFTGRDAAAGHRAAAPRRIAAQRRTFLDRASSEHAAKVRKGVRTGAVTTPGTPLDGAAAQAASVPATGMAATVYDRSLYSNGTGYVAAASADTLLEAGGTTLRWVSRANPDVPLQGETPATDVDLADFMALPASEAGWDATAAWDQRHGRWVVAATSWEYDEATCNEGWLLLAVSAGADPAGSWTRWRIPIGANSATDLSLGLSDELIAIGGDEYPLDGSWVACLGLPFSGARLRALDWADVLDGGTITVSDLTPAQPRRSWDYRIARNVPVGDAADAGADLRLVVDRYDAAAGRWGNVGFGRVSGGVVAGTAALSVVDLTAGGIVDRLVGPPWLGASPGYTIWPSFGDGTGLDEAAQSVSSRAGRLVFTAASSCIPGGSVSIRACVRAVTLDIVGAPALVDDTSFGLNGSDLILGAAGYARDGSTFALLDRVDGVVGTWRAPGETFGTPRDAVLLDAGSTLYAESWPARAEVVADPADAAMAWCAVPASRYSAAQYDAFALRGGLAGAPGGTVATPPAWSRGSLALDLAPDPDSPITRVIVQVTVPGNPPQVTGITAPSARRLAVGVGNQDGPRTVAVQWVTADGVASPPTELQTSLDTTGPAVWASPSFIVPQALGSTVRTRWTLHADDGAGIGVGGYQAWDHTRSTSRSLTLGAPWLSFADRIGFEHRVSGEAIDLLGNGSYDDVYAWLKTRLVQSSTRSVKVTGSWSTASASKASGGSVRTSRAGGATATLRATGAAFALVVTKGPGRGKLSVSIDGGPATTIDTRGSTTAYRQVVWQTSTSMGTHTIRVKVLGTAGRPRIDLDAFLVLEDNWNG